MGSTHKGSRRKKREPRIIEDNWFNVNVKERTSKENRQTGKKESETAMWKYIADCLLNTEPFVCLLE